MAIAALCGARGYVLKSDPIEDLCRAVDVAAAGGSAMGEHLAAAEALPPVPSSRELEVLSRIVAGDANGEAARACELTVKTVETYLRRMFVRYSVLSRTELAILALRVGWIDAFGDDARGSIEPERATGVVVAGERRRNEKVQPIMAR